MKLVQSPPMLVTLKRIDLKDCTIKLSDGTATTPIELTIKIGDGNITFSEKKPRIYDKDRGALDTVRDGDEEPIDVSMDLVWEYLTGTGGTGAAGTPEDFLKKRGAYSANVSSDSDTCAPYAVDIIIVNAPACGTLNTETITLSDFRYEDIAHDPKAATLSCSGKCNTTEATAVRS